MLATYGFLVKSTLSGRVHFHCSQSAKSSDFSWSLCTQCDRLLAW